MILEKYLTFIFMLLVAVLVNAQTWKSTHNLNSSMNRYDHVDLYTNADGNHLIIESHTNNDIMYYLFSYSGSQTRSTKIDSNW